MTDTTGNGESVGYDAEAATQDGVSSSEDDHNHAQVVGYETQLADADEAIARANAKVEKYQANVTEAEQAVRDAENERTAIQAALDQARAALGNNQ